MAIEAGTYKLGPDNATLRVKTGRHGAAAKAGHDLVIEVKSWEATLTVDDDAAASSVELTADPTSLHVLEGVGGMQPLGDDDKADIRKTIDKDVLKTEDISFSSKSVTVEGDGLTVSGDLTMGGKSNAVTFVLTGDGGAIAGSAKVSQSDWGIKPYSALFGALKVNDDVTVEVEGNPG
jgi:polyisoprenoid-binding protein YceI